MSEMSVLAHIEQVITLERRITDEKIMAIHKEIDKASSILQTRLEAMNELHAQINKDRNDYVRKDWIEGQLRLLGVLVSAVSGLIMLLINLFVK